MIRTVERASGRRYQVYGRSGGKQVYITTVDTEREAEELDEEHRVTQRKVGRGELAPQTDARRTFASAIAAWLATLERAGSRSLDEYRHRMTRARHIVDIGKADIAGWRDAMIGTVSGATVNTCMGTLSSAFTWFVDQGWIQANPCAHQAREAHRQGVPVDHDERGDHPADRGVHAGDRDARCGPRTLAQKF